MFLQGELQRWPKWLRLEMKAGPDLRMGGSSFFSFHFLRRYLIPFDQMWPFSDIWAVLGEPWALFLDIYLLLSAFWTKFLFSGGEFMRALIWCWAFFVEIGLFFTTTLVQKGERLKKKSTWVVQHHPTVDTFLPIFPSMPFFTKCWQSILFFRLKQMKVFYKRSAPHS